MLSRISFHVLYGRSFKTLCLLNYALMKRQDYDITVFFTKKGITIMVSEPGYETVGSKDLTCENWMVNTRTDAGLSAAVQNALQTLLPLIREEFRTSSGPSDAGRNPPPVTIHTWLERFNKQKPRSFEKAIAPVDEENWISHMEKIFDVMGCEDAFKTRLAERLKREYHSIRQTNTETSTEFMQRFLRLAGFLGAAAAQVTNAARNYEILHERDDDDAERPEKRRVVIGISRPLNRVVTRTTVIIMTVADQTGEAVVTTTAAVTTITLATTTGSQQSRGPSEGYSYPVCTTCGRRHPEECRRAAGTCFKCGQTGHLQKDCKKNTTASTSGQADKKPGASGRVFAITEDHATKTS
nr:hypothetical protein [Tanacetum cinerariifolium]